MARSFVLLVFLFLAALGSAWLSAAQPPAAQAPSNALPPNASGADVYRAACATCHGVDGRGAPKAVLGFDTEIRDFTECSFATVEPDPDWYAVVHEGGPIRALAREMPAFGDALTSDQMRLALGHVRTFCTDRAWPQGDLNFPRAFFTEKAFPENETVWETAVTTGHHGAVNNDLVYERRIGSGAPWAKGLGDVAIGAKRALFSSMRTGTIAAAGAEVIFPTGNEYKDLGEGTYRFEPFAMIGQVLPHDSYLQMHGGVELPADENLAAREAFLRTAVGTTIAQDRGFGRAWSPQVEVLWAKPFNASSEWDIVPQVQVSLSKLQHVLVAAGVRVPITQTEERKPQVLFYFLWDWFDGSLFDFWK
jgi:mono/diheme cytochrome c family protein